jgi:uncharacterized protein YecT (DUF1311 family)
MKLVPASIALVAALVLSFAATGSAAPLKIVKQEIKETKRAYEINLAYPRTGHPAIDRTIEGWARELATSFRKDAIEARDNMAWSEELSYEVARNDGQVLSLVFTLYNFTGGAHPNSSFRTFHFLLPDGYNAEIAEIFTPRGIKRISDISISQLRRDLGGPDGMSDADWIGKGAGPNARNFSSFVLTPRELTVYFDAYQVAAYAAGPQETHIPLVQLQDTMRPDVRAPAASFDCMAARSDVEQAICSSRELSKLDRQMAEAYADKLVWAEDDAKRGAMRNQQRAWLRYRDTSCLAARMNLVACLMPIYQKRVKELSAD